ncbi:MAG TPA: hypothetical protein VFW94_24130 [Candidatus Acidoferrales bacterium]|nr:hypothetical protein [Candidatus Acidoferrales bacterium]
MIYPAAMFIEMGQDSLTGLSEEQRAHQMKELFSAIGVKTTGEFGDGYLLGLQTARVILAGSVALAKAGINPDELL